MSNERSPRESCWTTTGPRAMIEPSCNRWVAFLPQGGLLPPHWFQGPPMPVVNREVVLPVDRERAWELITEPSELEGWLADEVEFEAEEDAPVRVAWDTGESREGVVEEVAERERIVFTWGDSRVEWALEDDPGGTRLRVTEHRHAADSLVWGPRLTALSGAAMLGRRADRLALGRQALCPA